MKKCGVLSFEMEKCDIFFWPDLGEVCLFSLKIGRVK